MKRLIFHAIALFGLAGCAASGRGPDAPVPASEPRESVRLAVDLVRAQSCEEAFDLALYDNRAVELIAWDAQSGRCRGRTVTIRYLAREASRDDIVRAASAIAEKVVAEPTASAPKGEPR